MSGSDKQTFVGSVGATLKTAAQEATAMQALSKTHVLIKVCHLCCSVVFLYNN